MQTSQVVQTPPKLRPKSGRTPLQPKNSASIANPKTKQKAMQMSVMKWDCNKENVDPMKLDSSLAEELSAEKEKVERMRSDRESTERMLDERDSVLDAYLKEMQVRWQFQKWLEMEVDRLFRLKELKSRCTTVSPIKSLREKEQGKAINGSPSEELKTESGEESELQSPRSSSSAVDSQKI